MKKILFISTVDFSKNGITTFIMNNASQMSRDNIKVGIVSPNKIDLGTRKILNENKISIYELPYRKNNPFKYLFNLIKVIKTNKYNLIHVNGNSNTMVIELMAAKIAGCSCRVSHVHNTKTDHDVLNIFLRPVFNYCVTERLACSYEAGKWLYKNKKYNVINNGININQYSPSTNSRVLIRKKYNLGKNDILIGNVGGFNFQKNQLFSLRILKSLSKEYKLILIGEGENFKNIKNKIREMELSSRVILTGNVNNVSDYLSAIDIFIMPSRFEGLPFSLVEAQASGLPCIVSDKISRASNLTGKVIYLPITDVKIWKKKIEKEDIPDFNKREQIALSNFNSIRKKGYDAKSNSIKLEKIFSNLIQNKEFN